MFDIIFFISITLLVVNFLSTWLWFFGALFINFAFRADFEVWWLAEIKGSYIFNGCNVGGKQGTVDVMLLFFLGALLYCIKYDSTPLAQDITAYTICTILTTITAAFLLRFLVDLTRNLTHNHKTGKSEKLEEMSERLARLEQQLGDK